MPSVAILATAAPPPSFRHSRAQKPPLAACIPAFTKFSLAKEYLFTLN